MGLTLFGGIFPIVRLKWGIFHKKLSNSHNTFMDLNNVMGSSLITYEYQKCILCVDSLNKYLASLLPKYYCLLNVE